MARTFVSCPRCDSIDMIASSDRWTERRTGFLSAKVDVTYYGTCNDCRKSFSVVVATDVQPGYRPHSIRR